MRKAIDLNIAPVDQYPVRKVLTKSDTTTSQIVLPRHSVEEHIIQEMPENLREAIQDGDKRANVWIVDDENNQEHFLTMVDRDHRYSIISWGHVLQNRVLNEGQEIAFGWMGNKLHFIVTPKDEDKDKEIKIEPVDKDTDEPPAKRRKEMGGPSGAEFIKHEGGPSGAAMV